MPTKTAPKAKRTPSKTPKKAKRGFALQTPERRSEIARMGGLRVSRNKRHMAEIGRMGGENSRRGA